MRRCCGAVPLLILFASFAATGVAQRSVGSGLPGYGAAIPLHTQTAATAGARAAAARGANSFNIRQDFPAPPGLTPQAAGYTGILPGAFKGNGGYARRGGYGRVPYPYFFSPYYYPSLDYGSAPYGAEPYDAYAQPGPDPLAMAQSALGYQVQQLSQQLNELAANQAATQQPAVALPPAPAAPPITVVLRTGQQLQVQNYAVMDQMLWDFSSQPVRKIPVANIDIPASTRATEAAGAEFPALDSSL